MKHFAFLIALLFSATTTASPADIFAEVIYDEFYEAPVTDTNDEPTVPTVRTEAEQVATALWPDSIRERMRTWGSSGSAGTNGVWYCTPVCQHD